MHLPAFNQIIPLSERRLVGGPPTQSLLPLKYVWLYQTYKKAQTNFWRPEEVGLGRDREEYRTLPPNVKHQYDLLFSMLTTMDLVVTEAVDVSLMRHASAPELRSWLALQGFQESVHTDSYVVISEEIGLDPDEVFTRYLTNPALYDKIAMCGRYSEMLDGLKDLGDPVQMEQFLVAYTFFSLILESLWFYLGLSVGTYPTRFLGKMTGTHDQFHMIRKDESLHYSVGLTVIGDIIRESPHINRPRLNQAILDLVSEGLKLEDAFALETYKDLPGMSVASYMEQCRFQMRFNLKRLGLSHPECESAELALPWVSESVELQKETSFFERKTGNYQVSTGLFEIENEVPDSGGNTLWDNPL
jgi:ribonucleoside-diphosphate reductase beta chain